MGCYRSKVDCPRHSIPEESSRDRSNHTNNMLAPEMEKEFGIDSRDLPRLREVAGQEFDSVISPLLKSWGAASWCTSIRHVFGPYGTVRPNALLFDAGDR
jgi:hypothetical protein